MTIHPRPVGDVLKTRRLCQCQYHLTLAIVACLSAGAAFGSRHEKWPFVVRLGGAALVVGGGDGG